MKRWISRPFLWQTAVLLLTISLWCSALSLAEERSKTAVSVGLRYESAEITLEQLDAAKKEDHLFAAWHLGETLTAKNPSNAGSASITPMYIYGDTGLITSGVRWLSGGAPTADALYTCAVDRDTAESLWGSADVLGMVLELDGKEYIISGVFDRWSSCILLPLTSAQNASALEIPAVAGQSGSRTADDFLSAAGLPSPDWTEDNPGTGDTMQSIALLPGWILFTVMLVKCLALLYRSRQTPFVLLILLIGSFIYLALLFVVVRFPTSIPAAMIPNRWADFSFWGQLWQDWKDGFAAFLSRGADGPDMDRNLALLSVTAQTAGVFGLAIVLVRLQRKITVHPYLQIAVGMAVSFAAVMGVYIFQGRRIDSQEVLWLSWPMSLTGWQVLRRYQPICQPPSMEAPVEEDTSPIVQ